jgi:hypothetical protein
VAISAEGVEGESGDRGCLACGELGSYTHKWGGGDTAGCSRVTPNRQFAAPPAQPSLASQPLTPLCEVARRLINQWKRGGVVQGHADEDPRDGAAKERERQRGGRQRRRPLFRRHVGRLAKKH